MLMTTLAEPRMGSETDLMFFLFFSLFLRFRELVVCLAREAVVVLLEPL